MPEVSSRELHECPACGAKSPWAPGFVETRTLFGGSRTTCATCWLYNRKFRGVYARWAFGSVMLVTAGYYVSDSAESAVLLALAIYAILYLAVVAHELGHAVTALALGFRVPALSLGGGLHSKVVSWRKTLVLLGPSPVEGLVLISPPSTRHYRKKMALVLVSGAFVFLCAALGYSLTGVDTPLFGDLNSDVASLWIGLNLLMVLNLLPVVSNGPFGALRSDGLQLLDLFKLGDKEIEERVRGASFTEAFLAFQYGDLERAYAVIAPALDSGGMQGKARVLATAVLVSMGKMEAGVVLAKRYLAADDTTLDERAMLMNNVACALVDSESSEITPVKIAEADELTSRAMEILPMTNAVRATRASVLVEMGAYREALALVSDRRFRLESRRTRATVKATLALALAGLGDTDAVARALQEGAALDPLNPHVRRARERAAGMLRGREDTIADVPAG
jgi:thioredoxin-like negative regulator of GroEL